MGSPPSVNPMPLFVFPSLTFTISREWVKSSAVPSNKELFALEMSLELSPLDSRERRCSPSNSTRRSSSPPDPETLLVCPSRVSPRTRRSTLVTLSTSRRRVNSCPSRLFAMVAVQEHPGALKVGYCPIIFSRTAKVACKMTKILWKQSKKTGNAKVEMPPELTQFENAEVEFEPTAPLFLEPFAKCAALGRIAVMDSNRLKMLGKVTGVTNAE